MTRVKRRYLLALVEGRICRTCHNGIVSPEMARWTNECGPCRVRRLDRATSCYGDGYAFG